MSDLQLGAVDLENLSASEEIDLTDQGSQSTAGAKHKGGRLHSDAWETFKKVPSPESELSCLRWNRWQEPRTLGSRTSNYTPL